MLDKKWLVFGGVAVAGAVMMHVVVHAAWMPAVVCSAVCVWAGWVGIGWVMNKLSSLHK